jgi:spectinomycin phosphotransferase
MRETDCAPEAVDPKPIIEEKLTVLAAEHGDGLMLVDWDTALLAPPERDVWTLADGDARIVDLYEATTGVVLLEDTLALYRLRWDLTEISIYVGQFQQPHRDTTDTSIAWGGLNDYLDPQRWQID